ncbi:ComA operon protein 2 [Thioalkalivibrio nitratireducens DSM 14787]|uniref:ComA operon protein 2 n=1 Tax=Thioalkalivibrio nitratireducens (strain DSM 14787 / UNIQEM 213 / ALEN2) TaxID=1255043 RepID=L0DWH5_THIND|nr:hotdog fold thioesterase [Thioalkalivibrio nitratireducens]AGA33330.1 ComA operon protein 2 [Thioalkalivibrio nitratireducens DSM 14787]
MPIWKRPVDLDAVNQANRNTLMDALGIRVTAVDDDALYGTLPVDERTRQPFGFLHGGASVALAETLGSIAANLAADPGCVCMGVEVNANHLKAVRSGVVTGCARPQQIGRSIQVWDVRLENERQERVCVARLTIAVREPR